MDFSFATSQEIRFGAGSAKSIPSLIDDSMKRMLVITGSSSYRHRNLLNLLEESVERLEILSVTGEPEIHAIDKLNESARSFDPDVIVAIGGGSVIDVGKAISGLLGNGGSIIDYVEGVGKGKKIHSPGPPLLALPTTSGSGAEVTKNAVIAIKGSGLKASIRSEHLLPRYAIVDPELTHELPKEVTASTGMDALIQCIEPFVSRFANPLSDGLAREGIKRGARWLKAAVQEGSAESREHLAVTSLCGGMALANAKLGAVHGFAGVIGGMIDAPHGALCASLLVPVMKMNLAMAQANGNHSAKAKFDELACLLTNNPSAQGHYSIAWLEGLVSELPLKSLRELGFRSDMMEEATTMALKSSSMKGNPFDPDRHGLLDALEEAMG